MLNIFKKDTSYFDLFDEFGLHVVSCARQLQSLARNFPASLPEIERIRAEEHAADKLTHHILNQLHSTFMPPIDREDVHTLAGELDDIVDTIEAASTRFNLFHIESIELDFLKQTDVLLQASVAVNEAVHKLRDSRKLSDIGPTLAEIHRLESLADDHHHAALSRLFGGTFDPLFVLKWKELYNLIEDAVDACEDVGHTLERIVLKGS